MVIDTYQGNLSVLNIEDLEVNVVVEYLHEAGSL